ncbi:MAG: MFS transporter [Oscillospiraceae bacterium]|jgi:Na+/melibiose symporter-like transporter|nr:MFS transporter [Oscillospiraceae bacterium]
MALTESQRNAIRHPVKWFLDPEPRQEGFEGEAIPRKELTALTVGLIGQNNHYNLPGTNWFFHFCTNVLKISPSTVGFMSGSITVFDACNDPVAGALIDAHRFKNGKKLTPWIRYTSPFIAVLAFLLFCNWSFESTGAKVGYCVTIYVLWDCLYSFQDASLWGLTAMISPNSGQRARAVQWADIGAFIGGLLPGLLLGVLSGDRPFGMSQQQIYLIFAGVLCLGGGFLSMTATAVKERVPAPPSHDVELIKNIGVIKHNYILLLFIASEMLNVLCPRVEDIYMFQQLEYPVFGKMMSAGSLVLILSIVTGLPGTAMKPFATKIADRIGGMKRIMIIGRLADLVVKLIAYFIGIKTLPALIAVYALQIIAFLPNGIYGIAMRTMIADSVDYVEWKTGERTEGITMSMRNFTSKITGAISRFMQGITLTFLQYNADNVDLKIPQNAHFTKWAWPMRQLGGVFGLCLSLIPLLLLKYPDSLKEKVERELAERRALKAAEESGGDTDG